MSKTHVAFFGLGTMGSGMARRLLAADFPVTVFNRNRDKAAAFAQEGAHLAGSPRVAAAQAEVLVSMVADDIASRAVWLGEHGALAGVARGAVLIECSTLTVGWVKELGEAAVLRGCEFLDAPVTGSKTHAASGELNFLAGGSAAALERVRPVLSAMGRSITHLGPVGSGALLKLINNFLCGVQAASLAEAMVLIEQSQLDPGKALDMLVNGTPGSPLLKTLSARMAARNYTPNFHLSLMAKDLAYSLQEGKERGVPLAMVASALEVFKQALASNPGDIDFSSVIEPLRNHVAKPGSR